MEKHTPDIYGSVALAGNEGLIGQVLSSQGPGVQVIWQTPSTLPPLYAYANKPAQVIVLGPADLTWNTPAADALSGITFGANQFTLPANRTYHVMVVVKPTVAALAYNISIVDTANNPVGALSIPVNGLASVAHEHAFAIIRPVAPLTIKVRMTSAVAITIGALSSIHIHTVD